LSFFPHYVSKTDAAKIARRDVNIFHHLFWGQRSTSLGPKNKYVSVFRRNAISTLAEYVSCTGFSPLQCPDRRLFHAWSFSLSASQRQKALPTWVMRSCECWLLLTCYCHCPVWAGAIPPYPFTSPLPHFPIYLLVSFTFLLFPFLIASSIFLLFHPFPFYQNSPTSFQGTMSQETTKPGLKFFVCVDCVLYVFFS